MFLLTPFPHHFFQHLCASCALHLSPLYSHRWNSTLSPPEGKQSSSKCGPHDFCYFPKQRRWKPGPGPCYVSVQIFPCIPSVAARCKFFGCCLIQGFPYLRLASNLLGNGARLELLISLLQTLQWESQACDAQFIWCQGSNPRASFILSKRLYH